MLAVVRPQKAQQVLALTDQVDPVTFWARLHVVALGVYLQGVKSELLE